MKRKTLVISIFILFTGCGKAEQDYFPMGDNHRREYIINEQVNNEDHVLKSIVADMNPLAISGVTYYPQHYASGEVYYFHKSNEGIFVSSGPGQTGKMIIGYPLAPNTHWQTETRIDILHRRHESFSGGESFISLDQKIILDFHIASVDDNVSVPAGRYSHCLRIEGSGAVKVEARTRGIDHILIEQTDWYARGIGLVKRIRTEKSVPEKYQGSLTQQLVSIMR